MPLEYLSKTTPKVGKSYYLDSSAVLTLASPDMATDGWPVRPKQHTDAKHLVAFLKAATGARVVTSVLAMEEAASVVRNTRRTQAAHDAGHNSWRDFVRKDAANAKRDDAKPHAAMLKALRWALARLSMHGVVLDTGEIQAGQTQQAAEALRAAHEKLLASHQELDPMDALHIVVGWDMGADDFVSFDGGWEVVPNITVYR